MFECILNMFCRSKKISLDDLRIKREKRINPL